MSAIVNKLAVTTIDPAVISFYRWLLALIILTPIVLPGVIGNRQAVRVNGWKLLVLGLLGMVLYQSLAYYAAHSVCALFMGIIASLIPLLTILISLALLRSAPTVDVVLGSVLSFSGMIWLISAGQPGALLQQGIGKGELMMLAATFSYALYGVLTKRWNIALPNWRSLYVQILFAVVLLLPEFLLAQDIVLDSHNIPMVLFAGIPASIIAPFLWVQGVMRLGANTAAIFMNLTPVFTAIIAVLFLHEQLHSYHLLGGGITLLGVILSQCLTT
ncbi:DMT family transporter [Serratia symbiotica]|uniref:DMT family transporter n=1 Tax=Serratia symbiotica TaxID=138074 RepID=UPI001F207BCE|nr:DMT family transporter [Serratia symbiotica]